MMRVYELARELGIEQRELVSRIRTLGFPVNNHMSALDIDAAGQVRAHIQRERVDNREETKISKTVFRRRAKKPSIEAPVDQVAATPETIAATDAQDVAATPIQAPEPEPVAVDAEPIQEVAAADGLESEVAAAPVEAEQAMTQQTVHRGDSSVVVTVPEPEELARRQAAIQEEQRRKESTLGRRQGGRETITKSDLYADAARFRRGTQRKKKKVVSKGRGQKTQLTIPKAAKRVVKMEGSITVGDLAKQMSVKSADVLKQLMLMGQMATINQLLDPDTTTLIAAEFDYEVNNVAFQESTLLEVTDEEGDLEPRSPVVTIMGHVDHGKTSLLDKIRDADVAAGEAGGITQHIGAYNVAIESGSVVFLDTPGHEAFTAMRARGAQATDIVILVVAADDGVMPQTIEAINHSRDAGVPIIVAVNKIDKDNANVDRVRQAVAEYDLVPEEWGGESQFVNVSAMTGEGISGLIEAVILQAEILELRANPNRKAQGIIIEARLETGRGTVATVLVQKGTLKVGDVIVAGSVSGKVRAMTDERGRKLKTAAPSTPVEIIGLQGMPSPGDLLDAVKDDRDAKALVDHRGERDRKAEMLRRGGAKQDLASLLGSGDLKELKVIVKGDVQGSVEAVREALVGLSTDKVKLNVIHQAVGGVTEGDVNLASAAARDSQDTAVLIVAFNVRAPRKVVELAESEAIEVKHYSVIYEAVEEMKQAMVGLLAPTLEERFLGRAEVRATFVIPKMGTIAGCMVTDGKVQRGSRGRLLRDQTVVWEGRLSSLRRFKDDVKEVLSGFECGIGLESYNDVKPGDEIEVYELEEVAASLND